MMKEYGHLLADDPDWRERAAAIVARRFATSASCCRRRGRRAAAARVPVRVAYDAPCHLLHAQRVSAPPLDVLRAIPELELVPLTESEVCCGSAGIYNLVEPDTSDVVLKRKLENIEAAKADVIATGNPGCLMQIGAGLLRAGSPVGGGPPGRVARRELCGDRGIVRPSWLTYKSMKDVVGPVDACFVLYVEECRL